VRPEVQAGDPERRARLVIADDHEGTRVLLRTLLSLHPEIEVVGEAENGEEAARLAVSGEADIALLDIEMPRMDGLTAAELIRSVRPQARVILHTASADETKRARARELGLTLLVKGDFDATIAAVTERLQEAKKGTPLRAGLEALVLSALAARSAEAVVVINAEQSISFYSAAAAKLLRLPLPAETDDARRDAPPASPVRHGIRQEPTRCRDLRAPSRGGGAVRGAAGRSVAHLLGEGGAVLRRRPIPRGLRRT
jgi:DNA-binding NarL/FixJ family response regulator